MADLADAAEVEVVVAPDWKFEIYRQAREAEKREAFVGTVMADERMQEVGEPAQSYAAELEDRTQRLPPVLDPDEEFELLDRASWLLDDEFGVDVTVRRAEESDERAGKARPGRPAIHVS